MFSDQPIFRAGIRPVRSSWDITRRWPAGFPSRGHISDHGRWSGPQRQGCVIVAISISGQSWLMISARLAWYSSSVTRPSSCRLVSSIRRSRGDRALDRGSASAGGDTDATSALNFTAPLWARRIAIGRVVSACSLPRPWPRCRSGRPSSRLFPLPVPGAPVQVPSSRPTGHLAASPARNNNDGTWVRFRGSEFRSTPRRWPGRNWSCSPSRLSFHRHSRHSRHSRHPGQPAAPAADTGGTPRS